MPRKTKQLSIDNLNFKNLNGTKTRIELLPNGKIEPYKKELWKADTIRLFSKTIEKKYGKMHTKKKVDKKKKKVKNKTVKKKSVKKKSVKKKSVKKKTISPKPPSYSPTTPTIKKNKTVKKKSVKKKNIKKQMPRLYRLEQAKKMLDSGLITQKQFDEIQEVIINEKCNTQKKKECSEKKKVCNPDTGRCKNPTIRKTVKKQLKKRKDIIKDLKTMSKMRSYSPSINKEIERLSISPNNYIMGNQCKADQIYVPTKGKNLTGKSIDIKKCIGWKTKKAQKHLLTNLNSTKKIRPMDIRGPFQNRSNCWFNTFFMMFFISDKGRKFMKAFRESMINGEFHTTKKKIPNAIRYPFWLLNKMVTASLIGDKDPEDYWHSMDTNAVIKEIYNKLKKFNKKEEVGFSQIRKPGEPGNPISMFIAILTYLGNVNTKVAPKFSGIRPTFGLNYSRITTYKIFEELSDPNSNGYRIIAEKKPHIIIIEFTDGNGYGGDGIKKETKANGKIPGTDKYAQVKDFKKKKKYKIGNVEYTLDSMGIRDIKQHHICALITLNKKDYTFDGENSITTQRKDWKKLLNKDQDFKITEKISETYNLTKGYQCLLYYRSK